MAVWIWSDQAEAAPRNRFTYFRKTVVLRRLPEDATLRFAADSNARLWINGQLVRRKVARYHEPHITAEVVDAGPCLRAGANVIVVLHHNWGDLRTFQRSGQQHAGLWVDSSWLQTDATWRCIRAPEFIEHDAQITGIAVTSAAGGDQRIRYPQVVDGRRALRGDVHSRSYDDREWAAAVVVQGGPWPAEPAQVETPGQREHPVRPQRVLAAGRIERFGPVAEEPLAIASGIRDGACVPESPDTEMAGRLIGGQPVVVAGRAGETRYLTVDFAQPVHGYPFLRLAEAPAGTRIDFGYGEVWRSQYDGCIHLDESGWLNPESVVGTGYADRYIARQGRQFIELPDERTARWLTLHIHFQRAGRVVIDDLGIVKSQYPIDRLGSFKCGDESVAQIVKLCMIHAEVTMMDAYVDTPGREDGQWLEDARPRALLAARWCGDTRLRDLLLRTHAEGQGKDGDLHPFAPSNFPAYPAPFDWSVQWVGMLYDDYLWTGDANRIRRYWETLNRYWKRVLSFVNRDGLWVAPRVLADIRVGLHPGKGQSSGIVTPWIIDRLRCSADMAAAIGEQARARVWRRKAEDMARAFQRFHIVPAQGGVPAHVADRFDPRDPAIERGFSQAGQTVAVYTGLLTLDEAKAVLDYAFPDPDGSPPQGVTRWNNPTYCYRALRALSYAGFTVRAVRHLRERYAPYLPGHPWNPTPLPLQGPYGGPLPEYWISREDLRLEAGQINAAQPPDDTGSHGWGAVPLLWLHETLLGVRIAEPGGGRLSIAPQTGGLPYLQGWTVTPKGVVWVSLDPQRWRMEITLPAGVTADVALPESFQGKRVAVEASGQVTAVRPPAQQPPACVIEGAGRYVFQVR